MRSLRGLFPQLIDPGHLEWAAQRAIRGKRRRPDVSWFLFRQEEVLARLQRDLASDNYHPDGFDLLFIRDPKARVVARSTIEDRVVHTALVALMEPAWQPSLLPDVFACRPGFGTHRAVLRLQELMRRHRLAVQLDIRAYFPSIHLDILRGLLQYRVRDARFMAVVDSVLEAGRGLYDSPRVRAHVGLYGDWPPPGRGLPMGALTSQVLASNLYLNGLDHFVKRDLKVPGYVRYVDDMVLFGSRRADLRRWRGAIQRYLRDERDLRLKNERAPVFSCGGHLDALGYRITRADRRALPRAMRRLRERVVSELARRPGERPQVDLERSLASSASVILF